MQRGQVAVASAFPTPPSNQFEETDRSQMPQHWTPPPPPRPSSIQPPSPPPDDQEEPLSQFQYRGPSGSGAFAPRRNYNKPKKPKQPCLKFLSGYGCSYGAKCRYSHNLRAFYPGYHDVGSGRQEDPAWSPEYAIPTYQVYPQRQIPLPPPMPKGDPDKYAPMPPQRERASSFGNQSKYHDNQTDDIAAWSCERNLLFNESVLRQSKVKLPDYEPATRKLTEGGGFDDENRHTNRDVMVSENHLPDTEPPFPRQYPRRKKNTHMRKCAAGDDVPNPAHIDLADFCLDPNFLLSEIGDINIGRAERARQAPQLHQPQCYTRPMSSLQLLNSVCPPYPQYATQGQVHSNISKQAENFVDYVDTQLASMELHQQQAIDSLQELVRSLWPDAIIDIYGSSYTRLALPASDIDCVLVSRTLAGERPLTILELLAAEVERQPWTKKLELLGSAKIPVLKMNYSLDPTQKDVLLDLTCGHSVGHTGLGARDLIYSFQAEMPALRPLVLILKSHLVSNDLNCAFTGGISSYVLVILVIRFLQACGDTHHKSFASTNTRKMRGGIRRRSYSENASTPDLPDVLPYTPTTCEAVLQPKWCYTFSRGGRVTWRTGIGSLLMLFLETYITFDYRRFGVSIDNEGEYFLLPSEKVVPMQCSTVIPYVSDPIKPGRSICNCFRMHEVIQSWLALYQNLAAGVPVTVAVETGSTC